LRLRGFQGEEFPLNILPKLIIKKEND